MGECELCRMGVYGSAGDVVVDVNGVNADIVVDVGIIRALLAVLKDRRDLVRVAGREAIMYLS